MSPRAWCSLARDLSGRVTVEAVAPATKIATAVKDPDFMVGYRKDNG